MKDHPDLVVLGVSLDDNLKQVTTFLKKHDLPWTFATDGAGEDRQQKRFTSTRFPVTTL
jgi:peroxiredoxin